MSLRPSLIGLCLLLALIQPPLDAGARQDEYQVKAVFVLNFARLTQWPGTPQGDGTPFTIAILGRLPSGAFMATLRSQPLHGSRILLRHVQSVAEARDARLVYISSSERHRLPAILKELRQEDILTVSDIEGFCEAGGMIALVPVQNRIGFEVNLGAVRRTRLTVSSQLLKLARSIHGN